MRKVTKGEVERKLLLMVGFPFIGIAQDWPSLCNRNNNKNKVDNRHVWENEGW